MGLWCNDGYRYWHAQISPTTQSAANQSKRQGKHMKQLIIQTNDALAYIAFALVAIVAVVCLLSGKVGTGLIIMAGGWVACSLIFGLWFCLSDIADNLRKIAEKQ